MVPAVPMEGETRAVADACVEFLHASAELVRSGAAGELHPEGRVHETAREVLSGGDGALGGPWRLRGGPLAVALGGLPPVALVGGQAEREVIVVTSARLGIVLGENSETGILPVGDSEALGACARVVGGKVEPRFTLIEGHELHGALVARVDLFGLDVGVSDKSMSPGGVWQQRIALTRVDDLSEDGIVRLRKPPLRTAVGDLDAPQCPPMGYTL